MSKEAMKLALEALESIEWHGTRGRCWVLDNEKVESAITALREDLAKPGFWEGYVPEPTQKRPPNCGTGHCSCIECVMKPAQQALDKMAENARELGLDYEPVWGGGPTNKDYEDAMRQRRLHQLTSPPAQRTWRGLTDEERKLVRNSVNYNQFVTAGEYAEHVQKATEAKLKEKNT